MLLAARSLLVARLADCLGVSLFLLDCFCRVRSALIGRLWDACDVVHFNKFAINPGSLFNFATLVHQLSVPVSQVVLPLSYVVRAIIPEESTKAFSLIKTKLAFVHALVAG